MGTQWAAKRAIPGIHRRYSDLKLYQTEQECRDGSNDWRYCRYAWPDEALSGERCERFGWQFRLRDKVIQTENNYDKEVFNGDIGQVVRIDPDERGLAIRFEEREVLYDFNELDELSLAYAITIHKSQGSEFPAVVVPLAMQHYLLLQRNLVYTAMTRGRRLVVLVGQRKALTIAVRNDRAAERFSGLYDRFVTRQIDPSERSHHNCYNTGT